MTPDSRNPHLLSAVGNHKLATDFLAEARQTGVLLAAALDQNHRLITLLQADANALATMAQVHSAPVEPALNGPLNPPSIPLEPAATYRRNHRPGTLSRITADPDLEAFIPERIDTATYAEIVAAVAATFPPNRRISMSGLQRWWAKRRSPTAKS